MVRTRPWQGHEKPRPNPLPRAALALSAVYREGPR